MVYPDDRNNGVSSSGTPRGPRLGASSYLPPGISLSTRAPPISHQPMNTPQARGYGPTNRNTSPPRTRGYGSPNGDANTPRRSGYGSPSVDSPAPQTPGYSADTPRTPGYGQPSVDLYTPGTHGYGSPDSGRSDRPKSGHDDPDANGRPRRRPSRSQEDPPTRRPTHRNPPSEPESNASSRRPSTVGNKPTGAAPLPRTDISAFLPPGISLNTRATPMASGRTTPASSYYPQSGRTTPAVPASGRATPTSVQYTHLTRSREPSRTRDSRTPPTAETRVEPRQTDIDAKPLRSDRERLDPEEKPRREKVPKEKEPIDRIPSEKKKFQVPFWGKIEKQIEKRRSKPPSQPPSRRPSESASNKDEFKIEGAEDQEKDFVGDENEERGNWTNKMDFVLSCLGYAVGLGNVWRFPYLAYRNGGGAFLIPYTIMLFFAGLPIFFMEVSFGQYCSLGPISCWRSVPFFRGIGYCQMFTVVIVGIYYNVIIMYTIYYLFASFTSKLPWDGCNNPWNDEKCYSLFAECVGNSSIVLANGTCTSLDSLNDTMLQDYNITSNLGGYNISAYVDPFIGRRQLASEQYWKNAVLQEADTMNEPGGVIWQLALCLLLAWIIVFVCMIKGIKSSGKVVYFTATFPYVVLFILLIRGVTLPGAGEGIKFFVIPDFSRLSDGRVWQDAAIQIFFSLSAAGGGLTTLASYNKFHNNCYWDSMFVAIANCCTSVFAGFVIFSIVGFMSHILGQPVDTVVEQGFGLAFIAYPAAVARMPVSPLWAILFFSMLLTLGLDSQFAFMENLITAIVDEIPALRKKKMYVLLVSCISMYIMGFSCITRTGSYWVSHLDSYGAFFNYIIYALLECVALGWVYGVKRLENDIRTMVQSTWMDHWFFWWWPMNWTAITPALMLFVLLFNFFNWTEPSYNGPFPPWARAIGWMITLTSLIWIPIVMIYELWMEEGTLRERWQMVSSPLDIWGPALPKFRLEAWKVHHRLGTTMGGRLDIDGSGRKWHPGEVKLDEEEEELVNGDNKGRVNDGLDVENGDLPL